MAVILLGSFPNLIKLISFVDYSVVNMNSKLTYFPFFLLVVLFVSCGEYNKILKNTNILFDGENKEMHKYEDAKKYFDEEKYSKTIILLEDGLHLMKGTLYAEKSLYLLAQSYYAQKNYASAAGYFRNYYTSFSKGEHAESARFYSAYSLYLESPDVHFDQSDTYEAMQQFQDFLKYYPCSEKKEIIQNILSALQEKLALKELISASLYYNLGNYILYPFITGGNYLSCVITAQNALQSYPFSKYREDFMYYIFLAKYRMALQNIKEGKDSLYSDVTDEYNSYISNYPSGKHLKEIQKFYSKYMNVTKKRNLIIN